MFVPSCYGSKRNYYSFLATLMTCGTIFMAIAISVTVNIFRNEAMNRRSSLTFNVTLREPSLTDKFGMLENLEDEQDEKLVFLISLNSIDLTTLMAKVNVNLFLVRGFQSVNNGFLSQYNLTIGVGQEMRQIVADQPFTGFDVPIPLEGDLNEYPYDEYTGHISIQAALKQGQEFEGAPTGLIASGSVQSLKISNFSVQTYDTGIIDLSVAMRRTTLTRGFSVFLITLMWTLSILILLISLDIVFRGREVAGPILAFPVASIFALPQLRNLQPGIPTIGTLADIMGFYWNMIFVSLSALIIGFTFVFRYRDKRQTKPSVDMSDGFLFGKKDIAEDLQNL